MKRNLVLVHRELRPGAFSWGALLHQLKEALSLLDGGFGNIRTAKARYRDG